MGGCVRVAKVRSYERRRRELLYSYIFLIFVFLAYGLWTPPSPVNPTPIREACSRKTITMTQRNNTDKAIYGHVIVYHKAVTVTQCGDFCLREPRCRAFNLATVIDPEGKKDCELLEEDKKIINRQGFSFWLFDRDSYKEVTKKDF